MKCRICGKNELSSGSVDGRCYSCYQQIYYAYADDPGKSDLSIQLSRYVFDIDIAIEDKGHCQRQTVNCKDCKMGHFILATNYKNRIDDMCKHEIVYLFAKFVKIFV